MNNDIQVTVYKAPISDRYWKPGCDGTISNGQIRVGGAWFNFDNRWVVSLGVEPDFQEVLPLSEDAVIKLEYITGRGFIRNFPNEKPELEWIGAVLDFLKETKKI